MGLTGIGLPSHSKTFELEEILLLGLVIILLQFRLNTFLFSHGRTEVLAIELAILLDLLSFRTANDSRDCSERFLIGLLSLESTILLFLFFKIGVISGEVKCSTIFEELNIAPGLAQGVE